MLPLRGEGREEPPGLSHAIPGGSDCGHGHGGAVLRTPPSSTPRTAGAGGEESQDVLESGGGPSPFYFSLLL